MRSHVFDEGPGLESAGRAYLVRQSLQGNFVPSYRDNSPDLEASRRKRNSWLGQQEVLHHPHYDGYPAVFVRFAETDVEALGEVLTDSWRLAAPKRVLAEFDAAEGRKRNKPT